MAQKRVDLPAGVTRLRQRIEAWRRRGEPRAMPPTLWAAAVALAKVHGICSISRVLRIDYGGLKRRMGTRVGRVRRTRRPRFVEVGDGSSLGSALGTVGTTVELWSADGSRLVIRLREGEGVDLLSLAASLWQRR
jgi:hypothetical protein